MQPATQLAADLTELSGRVVKCDPVPEHRDRIWRPHAEIDLAPVIRRLCENYWRDAGGSQERLNLRLEPLFLGLDRIRLLGETVQALLNGGLSPKFSPEHGALGVHLWSVDRPEKFANLLIADDDVEFGEEPSAPSITAARRYAEGAGCRLTWQPARGTVWLIRILNEDLRR
jgi:hypothetical protein